MVNPTSLPGVHIQNDGIMQCTPACSYSQPHSIAREKASSVVSQSIKPNSSVGVGHVNKIVMNKLQTTVDAWVGYGRNDRWQMR